MRFFLAFTLFSSILFVTAQVPNYEFEEWDSLSISSIASWNTLGTVEKTENAYNGNSAVRLVNTKLGGSYGVLANTNLNTALNGGASYSDMPFTMRFDIKYNLAAGDTATVLAFFKAAGQIVAQVDFNVSGNSADTFVRIKYPIQWIISTTPDTLIVILSSHTFETPVQGDGSIVFDNLAFETFGNQKQQLPNSNFENWDITSIPYPEAWYTTNLFAHDFYNLKEDIKSVVASKEAHYKTSLLLQNKMVANTILPGIALTGSNFSNTFPPAFSVSNKWKYIQGYYKFSPQNKDTGMVAVLMYNKGTLIGTGQVYIINATEEITYFSVPITYFIPANPDSSCIVLSSSDFDNPKSKDTKLWIDKLTFTNSIAGINDINSSFSVYPNPAKNRLNINSYVQFDTYEIYNDLGQCVLVSELNEINIETLVAGCYTIYAKNDSQTTMCKFVKLL